MTSVVAEIEARQTDIDLVSRESGAAVVYPILLPDRIELLVSLPSGLERYTVPVEAAQVEAVVQTFGRSAPQAGGPRVPRTSPPDLRLARGPVCLAPRR